uniref:Uncharacterized protein n=1 Tax=Schistosoma haematobium TaxID=6185 RepID=A0A095CAB2_SCHHA
MIEEKRKENKNNDDNFVRERKDGGGADDDEDGDDESLCLFLYSLERIIYIKAISESVNLHIQTYFYKCTRIFTYLQQQQKSLKKSQSFIQSMNHF